MFCIQQGALDLHVYEMLDREGRDALHQGDRANASRLLGQAADLWQGPPLIDVNHGRHLETQCRRLEEALLTTTELRITAELAVGHHHDVLSDLAMLTNRDSLHENFHTQYMLALYRCGRRSDALTVYRRLRSALTTELGLEPSRATQRLHDEILRADPGLDAPSGRPHGAVHPLYY